MGRTVLSQINFNRSARETWLLRNNFALEGYVAELSNRKVSLVHQDTVNEGLENEQTQRIVRCELIGEHLGGAMMGAVTSKDLTSEVTSNFFVNRFDEKHGADFFVEMTKIALDISISGHQWIQPLSDATCILFTKIELSVKITGVGMLVEMKLEKQLRASHAAFPKHAEDFLDITESPERQERQRQERKDRTERQKLPGSPLKLPDSSIEIPVGVTQALELPTGLARNLSRPELSRRDLVWKLLFGTSLNRPRKHQPLKEYANAEVAVVKIGARHAKFLVCCGCANANEDEIVE